MPVSESEFDALKARVRKLEDAVNDIFTSISQYVTATQVNQLLTISQTDIENLTTLVDELDDRVTAIEEEPLQ